MDSQQKIRENLPKSVASSGIKLNQSKSMKTFKEQFGSKVFMKVKKHQLTKKAGAMKVKAK